MKDLNSLKKLNVDNPILVSSSQWASDNHHIDNDKRCRFRIASLEPEAQPELKGHFKINILYVTYGSYDMEYIIQTNSIYLLSNMPKPQGGIMGLTKILHAIMKDCFWFKLKCLIEHSISFVWLKLDREAKNWAGFFLFWWIEFIWNSSWGPHGEGGFQVQSINKYPAVTLTKDGQIQDRGQNMNLHIVWRMALDFHRPELGIIQVIHSCLKQILESRWNLEHFRIIFLRDSKPYRIS